MSPSDPAARPTPKARRTRSRILDASLELFQERGFDKTSMRDIAARAGLSLGATYYHFRSKDDLVFAFYARTQEDAEREARLVIEGSTRFDERLRSLLAMRLDHLAGYRGFFAVLVRHAFDADHPLSPFGAESAATRDAAIAIMAAAIDGSDLRVHPDLAPRLPKLLWLLQMGIIFLWIHDESEGQRRTARIVDLGLSLVTRLLALSAMPIPGMGPMVELVGSLVDEVESLGEGPVREGESAEV